MRTSLLALLLFATAALAADPPDARIARVEHGLLPAVRLTGGNAAGWSLTERLVFHKVPGVSIAVIDGGTLAWARGYGLARAGSATPVTASTLFQAASISKPIAAAAALSLVEAGELALDADVNAKLKSWKVPAAPVAAGEPVTLRRLLSHTAGLSVHGFPGYAAGTPLPTLGQVLDGTPPANTAAIRLELRPGTVWRYSGGGYCVVQQLLTDVTGRPFADLVRQRVLLPAGMADSTCEQPLPAALVAPASAGHTTAGQALAGDAHVYPEQAAAGLWTTPTDLARFALALQHGLEGQPGFLSRATVATMLTPPLAGSDYGLGIGVKGSGNDLAISHNGSNAGFQCALIAYPRTGRGAVVMTNSDNGGTLINEILRAISREYGWPDYRVVEKTAVPLAPGRFESFVGRYERENTLAAAFQDGDHYFIQFRGQKRREIFPLSDHEFFLLDAPETISFGGIVMGRATYFVRGVEPPQIFQRVK